MNLNNKQQRGKKRFGSRAVYDKYNVFYITLPNNKDIDKDTLRVAVNRGDAGKIPSKRGRSLIVLSKYTNTLEKQAIMMQVAVKGEEKRKAMDNTANTIIF